jgi:NAD(P)-dependent dehydrogenase (short-subunit alcohol dehydrogenase family)
MDSRHDLEALMTTNGRAVDLTGQVALVTGGGDGLGRAFALALAKAGVVVAVTGRRAEPLAETVAMIERSGGRALAVPTDVTTAAAVTRVVRTVEANFAPIDILVTTPESSVLWATTGAPIRTTGGAPSK